MTSYDLIVRNARVIDPVQSLDKTTDIAVSNQSIVGTGNFGEATAEHVINGDGLIVSPGWIDLHAHLFEGVTRSGVNTDSQAGIANGVTTAVDAGSSGAWTWEAFKQYVIAKSETRVRAFMNISLMPAVATRHGDWRNFNQSQTISLAATEADGGRCLGIKVLASQTHCGPMGITPVKLARQAARLSKTRLMVHIGNAPPVIEDVLELLDEGDIVTHCWHGKHGGLLDADNQPLPEVREAVERGVRFDIGHGSASFSFETARHALAAGLPLHAISTDIHSRNLSGPVYDMATTMSKFLHLQVSLPEVISLATSSPAQIAGLDAEAGSLEPGRVADFTIFREVHGDWKLVDSEGRVENANSKLEVVQTIREGKIFDARA